MFEIMKENANTNNKKQWKKTEDDKVSWIKQNKRLITVVETKKIDRILKLCD